MASGPKPVALITGASSGIGKDFALRLLSVGYVVYGAARRVDHMKDIEAAGGVAVEMDVTHP
jgi:NADP-dependent 3-hydroxy acid dehydrogenase YdfG